MTRTPTKTHESRRPPLTVFAILFLTSTTSAFAVEPWADERLKERDGLLLWLDALVQTKAAAASNHTARTHDVPIDVWFDGSGNRLDVRPPTHEARPKFVSKKDDTPFASIRFSGNDDCLTLTTKNVRLDHATLILVAAPRDSRGEFRAMISAAAKGQNDYSSGLNVDSGPWPSPRFDTLNVEGAGAVGFANLLSAHPAATGFEHGTFHAVAVTFADGAGGIGVRVDGRPAGKRDRAAGAPIALDQLVVGARLFSNEGKAPFVRSFFDGKIAEVLLYDRVLGADEIARVEKYLDDKYGVIRDGAKTAPPPPGTRPLVPVNDPPAVQMFVPGFEAKRLPLDLTNINNVRYRADGKLVALAYDGNVYLLTDTNADGLEDRADLFWDNQGKIQSPIGMVLTPLNYPRGDGLFIAAKGKLSLVVDTDKDDKADKEIVVATGWPVGIHQVDALGVALEPDGSILFGLGTLNFANAYGLEPDGSWKYDIKSERGTILRVSPDFSKREIVATGIRFPVALAHNAAGDLFCTDQEGATWLANGNPFDELLHIQPGRHYGFPPRHPKYLPGVIDEPSEFDYRPQHQSTCGLVFNLPVNGGPVFGPKDWTGDAIVTGYSRGKIYRTQFVKTPAGYVARNHLIANMAMMPADACVTPKGELVIAAHGGQPDWGTGPAGKGALFKISHSGGGGSPPLPAVVYAATEREVRVAYDRRLDPASLKGLAEKALIDFGDAVSAGDRFESQRPGYEVVKRQMLSHRFALDVQGVAVTPDRRTLILQTAPMSSASSYALTLPRENDATDVAYDLTGVLAEWTPGDGEGSPQWTGWLPHLDFAVASALTAGSADHDALREHTKAPGVLRIMTQIDLSDMLRPAVQPGAKIDYEWPPETVTLVFAGPVGIHRPPNWAKVGSSKTETRITVSNPKQWLPLSLVMETGKGAAPSVSYHTAEDPRPRALPLRRILVPWAKPSSLSDAAVVAQSAEPKPVPELAGGSWARGRDVFHSEQAMCAKCHVLREDGGTSKIGPDLSNLHHRDYASVLQDVTKPSVAINPDHVAYILKLVDGNELVGVPRSEDETTLIIGEAGGSEKRIERSRVKSMEPLPNSIMPHGIDQVLGKEKLRDLMTFLLAAPLEPAKIEIPGAPPPRTWAEVAAFLPPRGEGVPPAYPDKKTAGETPAPRGGKALRILLAAGPKDHGPGEHDYPLWQRRWTQLLSRAPGVEVDSAFGWPEQKQFDWADVIVFFSNNPGWSKDKAPQLDAYLKRGGGLIYLHYAVDGHADPDVLGARIGLAWKGGASKFRHGPLDLAFRDAEHPITRGFKNVKFVDESYWQLIGDPGKVHVLASSAEDGAPRPLMWTFHPHGPDAGRVFVNILGHYNWTFDDPLFRVILLRAMTWCARVPDAEIDRLTPLATLGARLAPSPAR